jgi:hypothetical protein
MSDLKKISEFLSFKKVFKMDKRATDVLKKILDRLDYIDVIKYGDHKRRISLPMDVNQEKNNGYIEDKDKSEIPPDKDFKKTSVDTMESPKDVKKISGRKNTLELPQYKDVKKISGRKNPLELPPKFNESNILFFDQFLEANLSSKIKNLIDRTEKTSKETDSSKNINIEVIKNSTETRDWRIFRGKNESYVLVINGEHFIDSEGNSTVNPKLVKIYLELLKNMGEFQSSYKRLNMSESEYKNSIMMLKNDTLKKIN